MTQDARSPRQIESDIEAARSRLAGTIDELAHRAQPAVIAERQKDVATVKVQQAFMTPAGDLRMERVAAVAGVVVVLVGIAILRRVKR